MTTPRTALVLAGGGLKIFYLAGWLQIVLTRQEVRDLYGVSAGAIVAAFLSERRGRGLSTLLAAQELVRVLESRVRSRNDIAESRHGVAVAWDFLRGRPHRGFLTMGPLEKLLQDEIDLDALRRSPLRTWVAYVRQTTRELEVEQLQTSPSPLLAIRASSSIPVLMDAPRTQGNGLLVDGGVRDVAPIGAAIDAGAEEIIVVLNHPQDDHRRIPVGLDLRAQIDWTTATMGNEILEGDVREALLRNELVKAGRPWKPTDRVVRLLISRPSEPISIGFEFSAAEALEAVARGGADGAAFISRGVDETR